MLDKPIALKNKGLWQRILGFNSIIIPVLTVARNPKIFQSYESYF